MISGVIRLVTLLITLLIAALNPFEPLKEPQTPYSYFTYN